MSIINHYNTMEKLFNCPIIVSTILEYTPVFKRDTIVSVSGLLWNMVKKINNANTFVKNDIKMICGLGYFNMKIIRKKSGSNTELRKMILTEPLIAIYTYDAGHFKNLSKKEVAAIANSYAKYGEPMNVDGVKSIEYLNQPLSVIPELPELRGGINMTEKVVQSLRRTIKTETNLNTTIRALELYIQFYDDYEDGLQGIIEDMYLNNDKIPLSYKLAFKNRYITSRIIEYDEGIEFIVDNFRLISKENKLKLFNMYNYRNLLMKKLDFLWDQGLIGVDIITILLVKNTDLMVYVGYSFEFQCHIIKILNVLIQENGDKFLTRVAHKFLEYGNENHMICIFLLKEMVKRELLDVKFFKKYYANNDEVLIKKYPKEIVRAESELFKKIKEIERVALNNMSVNILMNLSGLHKYGVNVRVCQYKFMRAVNKKQTGYYTIDELSKFVENERGLIGYRDNIEEEFYTLKSSIPLYKFNADKKNPSLRKGVMKAGEKLSHTNALRYAYNQGRSLKEHCDSNSDDDSSDSSDSSDGSDGSDGSDSDDSVYVPAKHKSVRKRRVTEEDEEEEVEEEEEE